MSLQYNLDTEPQQHQKNKKITRMSWTAARHKNRRKRTGRGERRGGTESNYSSPSWSRQQHNRLGWGRHRKVNWRVSTPLHAQLRVRIVINTAFWNPRLQKQVKLLALGEVVGQEEDSDFVARHETARRAEADWDLAGCRELQKSWIRHELKGHETFSFPIFRTDT